MKLLPRQIIEGDLPGLMALYACLHRKEKQAEPAALEEAWSRIINNRDFFTCYIIEKDGMFIASASLSIIPNLTRQGRPYAVVENVITHPGFRRQGHGFEVMQAVIDHARMHNCYKIMLLSSVNRIEAHAFYDKLGFDRHAKQGFHLAL